MIGGSRRFIQQLQKVKSKTGRQQKIVRIKICGTSGLSCFRFKTKIDNGLNASGSKSGKILIGTLKDVIKR